MRKPARRDGSNPTGGAQQRDQRAAGAALHGLDTHYGVGPAISLLVAEPMVSPAVPAVEVRPTAYSDRRAELGSLHRPH